MHLEASAMAFRFGIHSGQQNTTYAELLALWQQAEKLGFEWASVFDHFIPIFTDPEGPCFDGLTTLAALASSTSKLRCGVIVTGVTYRNPAHLAKIAVTLDHISKGRMELGMGAAWFELEHQQYGFDFPAIGKRMDMLEEAVTIVKSLFTQDRTTFAGEHFQMREALFLPKPLQKPSIPIWIGGGGEKRTLKIVARHADGWNYFMTTPEDYSNKLAILKAHCDEAGREPASIRKSIIVRAVLDVSKEAAVNRRAGDDQTFFGTAAELSERLKAYRDLGVEDFLMLARPPADDKTLELFAGEVAATLRSG